MMNLCLQEVSALMRQQDNIRHVCLLGENNQEKAVLLCHLTDKFGMHFREPEQQPQQPSNHLKVSPPFTTLRSARAPDDVYLLNVLSPQQPNYHSDTIASIHITDGALFVADFGAGTGESPLQAMLQRTVQQSLRSILFIDKIHLPLASGNDCEHLYRSLEHLIDNLNARMMMAEKPDQPIYLFNPVAGNVAFGSSEDGWAFTLGKFAAIYCEKFQIDPQMMTRNLWGGYCFDTKQHRWRNIGGTEGKNLTRSFVQFVLEPISKLYRAVLSGNNGDVAKMLGRIGVPFNKTDEALPKEQLLRVVMGRWLPVAECLSEMMILHLPSPQKAQKHRTAHLYTGPSEDMCAASMKNCDPKGPLVLYIAKQIVGKDRLYSFARIFSGTASCGMKVRVMGQSYKPNGKEDLFEKNLEHLIVVAGSSCSSVPEVTCGNFVLLSGIDKYVNHSATVSDHPEAFPFRTVSSPYPPVLRVYVRPKIPADLPNLVKGLEILAKSDSSLRCFTEETGEFTVSSCFESSIAQGIDKLEREFASCQLIKTAPTAIYREAITAKTGTMIMVKSQNKHNRLYATAEPLSEQLSSAIEEGKISGCGSKENLAKTLCSDFGWEKSDALKVWSFGPGTSGPNLFVDMTKAVNHLNEMKDSMVFAWQHTVKGGVLANEQIRGLRVNLMDCELRVDAIHRGGGQIIPASRRLFYACELANVPTLLQPFYRCQFPCGFDAVKLAVEILNAHQASFVNLHETFAPSLCQVSAMLPVTNSIGFDQTLLKGGAPISSLYYEFIGWELLPDLPYDAGSEANRLVREIRLRKGFKEDLPVLEDYRDVL